MASTSTTATGSLACDSCGRLPHPRRLRLTAVKLAAVLPAELLLHALVLHLHPPYLVSVVALAVTTTLLVIWVIEPSAMRVLGAWLHGPDLRRDERLRAAGVLWKLRLTVDDEPGSLGRVADALAGVGANILDVQVHGLEHGARDELVLSAPEGLVEEDLVAAVETAGARAVLTWPTTALALVDAQTRSLALAVRVAEDPAELPFAVAELLGADVTPDPATVPDGAGPQGPGQTTLRLPTPGPAPLVVTRPEEAFTPAESARAHRLAQIAEIARLRA